MSSRIETLQRIAIIGASGGIGEALVRHAVSQAKDSRVWALSRSVTQFGLERVQEAHLDLTDEASIQQAAADASVEGPLDLVILATGWLHDGRRLQPERRLADLHPDGLTKAFALNTIGPALVAKHFLPHLNQQGSSVFAALSARVGSISDNRLGGWYGYRSSKAALNMIIRTLAIEMARRNQHAIVVGLHPGTVDTTMSKPFQRNVRSEKLFSPHLAASQLWSVIQSLTPEKSGNVLAWDGSIIPA